MGDGGGAGSEGPTSAPAPISTTAATTNQNPGGAAPPGGGMGGFGPFGAGSDMGNMGWDSGAGAGGLGNEGFNQWMQQMIQMHQNAMASMGFPLDTFGGPGSFGGTGPNGAPVQPGFTTWSSPNGNGMSEFSSLDYNSNRDGPMNKSWTSPTKWNE